MNTFPEALYKSAEIVTLGWNPEPGADVESYNLYVGQVGDSTGSLTLLTEVIPGSVSSDPRYSLVRKVSYDLRISDVRTALGLAPSLDFEDLILYFALTYTDSVGAVSTFSRIVEVPPVGIMGRMMKEDPSINRHLFGFSDDIQRWVKAAASGSGALIVDMNSFYKTNTVTEYTRDSSGNVLTEKTYFSDRTSAGSPAKYSSYEYSGGFISKVTTIDSTV